MTRSWFDVLSMEGMTTTEGLKRAQPKISEEGNTAATDEKVPDATEDNAGRRKNL